jgi:DNA-binding response OmpR family regulator
MPKASMASPAPTVPAARVLVVEDEPKVARALREGLAGEGYDVVVALTGEDGFFRASSEPFDLLILDRMLPGREGLEVLRTLRQKGHLTPVLVLTARDAVEDRVEGLDAGADDYMVKPFAFTELLARVRALVRRGRGDQLLRLAVADLTLDVPSRRVTRSDVEIDLTPREYELLEYLVRHRGTIVSREMLARDVWKEPERGTPLDNVIDVHVTRLRKKVDQGFAGKLIHTVRGVGFLVREGELA